MSPAPLSVRFLAFGLADAATNMAVDEAILEAHLAGLVPPTLRLYGFEPPAVSLGHTQKLPDGLLDRARARGFEVVRRPTGGRAVLHFGDLTYSFVAGSKKGRGSAMMDRGLLEESVSAAYKQICKGLQNAFRSLGLDLDLGSTDVPYRQLHDCFLATTGSDLQFNGKKMVGSAQLRRKSAVLQHGSILLDQPQSLLPELLGKKIGEVTINDRHANLFDALGKRISHGELEEALKAGFASAFGVDTQPGPLTPEEHQFVDTFKSKYLLI